MDGIARAARTDLGILFLILGRVLTLVVSFRLSQDVRRGHPAAGEEPGLAQGRGGMSGLRASMYGCMLVEMPSVLRALH